MRADDDVDFAGFEGSQDLLLFGGGAKAAEHFNADWKGRKSPLEGFEMLEREYGRGRKKRDLLRIGNGLEGRAHGHFGLAIADIAAEEAVHRCGAFHVFLDVGDRGVLVGSLLEFEGVFEFALEISIGRKRKPWRGFPGRVQRQKLVGHVFQRFAYARLARVPAGAAEFVERGMWANDDAIALYQVHALERDIETRILGVTKEHEFAAAAVGFDLAQALELPDTVVDVHHKIAGFQFG